MKLNLLVFVGALFCVACNVQQNQEKDIYTNIPDLESVAGVWMHTDTMAMEPSIRNFRAQALVNRDLTSIAWFASAPYSGGYHTGTMKVNNVVPKAQFFRWLPWEALRKGTYDTYALKSSVRMVPEEDAIMWEVIISNNTNQEQHYGVEQDLIGFISRYDKEEWPWTYPYPTLQGKTNKRDDEIVNVLKNIGLEEDDFEVTRAEVVSSGDEALMEEGKVTTWPTDSQILDSEKYKVIQHAAERIVIADTETSCYTAFAILDAPDSLSVRNSGGTASWSFNLSPNESKKIRFIMSYAPTEQQVVAAIDNWSNTFDTTFAGIEDTWQTRWKAMFKPDDGMFSGSFPVLETDDSVAKKVYYTGPLTLLYLLSTNLPEHDKVFLTGGPRFGATVTFFWDITEWSTLWAVVDPVMMKEHLKSWVSIDPDKHFGQDNYSGKGVGNGYSANYWALFQMLHSYITVSQDYAFLDEVINQKTVMEHLERYANNWKNISKYGTEGHTQDIHKLADFGDDPWNLLECVPTYIHIVPAFNVGYVWMMRETAKFHEFKGNQAKAAEMKSEADEMAGNILKLYAGNGVWNSLHPNDQKIEVRHVLDFMFFGRYMSQDLPENMSKEMVDFVAQELMTDTWMRAQSLKDIAAKNSDRPDHGPLGAFDGWPAGTMDALFQMGYREKALDFYRNIAPVTEEGIWAQAHELWGENKFAKNAKVRIAKRGWHNRESSSGIAMSQVMLKNFMGFYPNIGEDVMTTKEQQIDFSGSLYNVLHGGKYYNFHADKGTVKVTLSEKDK